MVVCLLTFLGLMSPAIAIISIMDIMYHDQKYIYYIQTIIQDERGPCFRRQYLKIPEDLDGMWRSQSPIMSENGICIGWFDKIDQFDLSIQSIEFKDVSKTI